MVTCRVVPLSQTRNTKRSGDTGLCVVQSGEEDSVSECLLAVLFCTEVSGFGA
jgi:hypothetical protein